MPLMIVYNLEYNAQLRIEVSWCRIYLSNTPSTLNLAWRHPIKDQTSHALKFSGLMRRLAALTYDSFLLFGITFAGYGTLLLLLKIIFHGVDNLEDVQPGPHCNGYLPLVGSPACSAIIILAGANRDRPWA